MDDDDFRALITLLEEELGRIGAGDIADERNYLRDDGEDGDRRLHEPQKRLVLMLEAFGRKLAIEDRATYEAALAGLNDAMNGEGPRRAILELSREETRMADHLDLGDAPQLGSVREALGTLVEAILRSEPPRRLG